MIYLSRVQYRFRVERSVKRKLGEFVTVSTSGDDATCGFDASAGERMAMFIGRGDDGEWHSGLCSLVAPDRLLVAAAPLPRPDSRGPPAFLIGTQLGDKRVVAIDAGGRTVAYGAGTGRTEHIEICPGGVTAAEVSVDSSYGEPTIAVRELPSLRVLRSTVLPTLRPIGRMHRGLMAISCRDRLGEDVLLVTAQDASSDRLQPMQALRVRPDGVLEELWAGSAFDLAFDPKQLRLFVTTLAQTESEFLVVELGSRTVQSRMPLHGHPVRLTPRPDGRMVAVALSDGEDRPPRLQLLPTGRGEATEVVLKHRDHVDYVVWFGADRLAVVRPPQLDVRRVDVYDEHLRSLGRWTGWVGGPTVLREGRLFGLRSGSLMEGGSLHAADPARGERTRLGDVVPSTFGVIAAMPVGDVPDRNSLTPALQLAATLCLVGAVLGLRLVRRSKAR